MTTTSPMTAVEYADAAAEAIRALNHATLSTAPETPGYVWPSDIDTMVGHLGRLAAYLQQALAQAEEWLYRAADEHRVRHDGGDDPGTAVVLATMELAETQGAVMLLRRYLDDARAQTNHLAGVLTDNDGEDL